jgi:hypothetical protein
MVNAMTKAISLFNKIDSFNIFGACFASCMPWKRTVVTTTTMRGKLMAKQAHPSNFVIYRIGEHLLNNDECVSTVLEPC